MADFRQLRDMALRLPDVVEGVHRGGPAFRVSGKTFALWWAEGGRTIMKLSARHQPFLFEVRPEVFQPCRVGEAWSTVVPKRVSKAFVALAPARAPKPNGDAYA
jgi:hypothetical protein